MIAKGVYTLPMVTDDAPTEMMIQWKFPVEKIQWGDSLLNWLHSKLLGISLPLFSVPASSDHFKR